MDQSNLKTAPEMLLHWERSVPEKIYLRQPVNRHWREFSWAEVADQARRIASSLRNFGLQPGDKVGIFSKNCAEWVISDLAIMLGGFISVPVYSSANAETLGYMLNHSEAKAVFIGKLDSIDGLGQAIPESCVSIAYPYPTLPAKHEWNSLIQSSEPIIDPVMPALDDVMTILYTSGSTGNSKGAVHTYYSFAFAATKIGELFDLGPHSQLFSYLPLAHCTERAYQEGSSLYGAVPVSFTESLDTFFDDLKYVRPTSFGSVPRLWKRFQLGALEKVPQEKLNRLLKIPLVGSMVKRKIAKGLGLDRSHWNGSGAAPMATALLEWWASVGIPVFEGWGMTETFAYGTQTPPGEVGKIGTIGKAYIGTEMKLSNEGELLIKSQTLMREYYKEPELTASAFNEEGFFKTGDRAEIDEDGYIKITGRLKEIFKTEKGKYVAPVPIESLLLQNPLIEQTCVVGYGRKQPVALVQLSESHGLDQSAIVSSLDVTLSETNCALESHEQIERLIVIAEAWTPENGMLTPTLKIKRHLAEKKYEPLIMLDQGPLVMFEPCISQ